MHSKPYTIAFCRGSNGGAAIYTMDEDSGYRIFGPKCCGQVQKVGEFVLTSSNIDDAITELTAIKERLRKAGD